MYEEVLSGCLDLEKHDSFYESSKLVVSLSQEVRKWPQTYTSEV